LCVGAIANVPHQKADNDLGLGTGFGIWGVLTKPGRTKTGMTKPGHSDIGLGFRNKVKDRVRVRVRFRVRVVG